MDENTTAIQIIETKPNGRLRTENNAVKKIDVVESRTSLRNKTTSEKENGGLSASSGSVPVIFATANGLHYQTAVGKQSECISDSEENVTEPDTTDTTLTQVLTSRKCDVIIGGEDTSDYDSQFEDPFATSNPISVKSHHSVSNRSQLRGTHVEDRNTRYDGPARELTENDGDVNSKRRKHKKAKRDRDVQEVGVKDADKASEDSGRDSFERHRLKSSRRTEELNRGLLDQVNGNALDVAVQDSNLQDNIANQHSSKKRKKKKRRKQNNDVGFVSAFESEAYEQESSFQHKPPPRLLPKLDIQAASVESFSEDIVNHQDHLVNKRPLPEPPHSKRHKQYQRQVSEQTPDVHSTRATVPVRPRSAHANLPVPDDHDVTSVLHDHPDSCLHLLENGASIALAPDDDVMLRNQKVTKKKRKKKVDV